MSEAGNTEQTAMQLILHGGEGKSLAMEAMAAAREHQFKTACQKLDKCEKAINQAHSIQTTLIQSEAQGDENIEINLLMIHAQDHLMNAMTTKDLAKEIIHLHEKLENKEV
ncbi:PTS lactose/cellobiose transporter subunit IIA [Salicibibacter cibi]|uniref:PTS lactose/cellobiose transporter subunit IIA n=1 Tax=Salicibibacter cibi TaxID=2743001 RepID=A0A7T7CFP8_9BACI|nr:PTS lactose/cellobiose transporter subunit IIA [Salicibibacter cibi]QQK80390.1 PTS lactose/cellobiose transporter subunit IIA [Salicibibacter cibi]